MRWLLKAEVTAKQYPKRFAGRRELHCFAIRLLKELIVTKDALVKNFHPFLSRLLTSKLDRSLLSELRRVILREFLQRCNIPGKLRSWTSNALTITPLAYFAALSDSAYFPATVEAGDDLKNLSGVILILCDRIADVTCSCNKEE